MILEVVDIIVDYKKFNIKEQGDTPKLYCYSPDKRVGESGKRPSVVICPGGSYVFTSDREAEPIALYFLTKGFNCFVLRYSVAPMIFPGALAELSEAVSYIRKNSDKYLADENKIITCGFSAGGHLVASHGVHWNKPFIKDVLNYNDEENKPNGMILCYPVITSGKHTHSDSIKFLLGEENQFDEYLRELVSLEKQVSKQTPPTFIWHTADDDVVPVENSLDFASELRKNKIKFEMHIFPHGAHGLSLANKITGECDEIYVAPECECWIDMASRFICSL